MPLPCVGAESGKTQGQGVAVGVSLQKPGKSLSWKTLQPAPGITIWLVAVLNGQEDCGRLLDPYCPVPACSPEVRGDLAQRCSQNSTGGLEGQHSWGGHLSRTQPTQVRSPLLLESPKPERMVHECRVPGHPIIWPVSICSLLSWFW